MSQLTTPIEETNIAHWLGLTVRKENDERIYRLSFHDEHIGNPLIRAIHGGVVGAFVEAAAESELAAKFGEAKQFKAISLDIDYLTSTKAADVEAIITITRVGRRIAFVEAIAWQEKREKPVVGAKLRFRVLEHQEKAELT